jgi:hypothetical protein
MEEATMAHVAEWNVKIFVFDYEDSVNARAELQVGKTTLTGHGHAQWIPGEPNVPEVGDGVAVSRALSDLADRLMLITKSDIESLRNHSALERKRAAELVAADAIPAVPDGLAGHRQAK